MLWSALGWRRGNPCATNLPWPLATYGHFGLIWTWDDLGTGPVTRAPLRDPLGSAEPRTVPNRSGTLTWLSFTGDAFIPKKKQLLDACRLFARLTLQITRFYSNLMSINPLLLQEFCPDHAAEEEKQGSEPRANDGKRYIKNYLTSHH